MFFFYLVNFAVLQSAARQSSLLRLKCNYS